MRTSPKVRFALPREASQVVDIIRKAFPTRLIRRTLYDCPGAGLYIRALTSRPDCVTPRYFVVAGDAGLIAAAEVGVTDSIMFLSYIGTRSKARSRGVGTLLMGAIAQHGLDQGLKTISLDTLSENTRAQSWYKRLGFSAIEERAWWEFPIGRKRQSRGFVSGWPQAQACHKAFGFSEITVWSHNGASRVGLLGNDWFRLPSLTTLADEQVLGTLGAIDSHRRMLVMGPFPGSGSANRPLFRLIRLQAALTDLRRFAGHMEQTWQLC